MRDRGMVERNEEDDDDAEVVFSPLPGKTRRSDLVAGKAVAHSSSFRWRRSSSRATL